MSDSAAIKQYQKIIQALTQQKQVELDAIARINHYISKKKHFITKINEYRREYDSVNGLRLSHQQPALMINMNHFLVKMQQSIANEERAITQAEADRDAVALRLKRVEQRIKAMEILLKKKQHHQSVLVENKESEAMDELVSYQR